MLPTFINLPPAIQKTISAMLAKQTSSEWVKRAELVHKRYMTFKKDNDSYLQDYTDALSYVALRAPATYTQIYSTLATIKEVAPSFKPTSILDIGSGPGVGMWAAQTIYPQIEDITNIDQNKNVIALGKEIAASTNIPTNIVWKHADVKSGLEKNGNTYDIILLANILNELHPRDRERLIGLAFNLCKGVLIIIEPGTPNGSTIVQSAAKSLSRTGTLLAPYINNSFVENDTFWMHFSKRFMRPEFTRRIRQYMRDDMLSASNIEEAKFAYVAIGKQESKNKSWGRCIGSVRIQKGFLEVPILTADQIMQIKVLKRNKKQYTIAKNLTWGKLIKNKSDIVFIA